jgi:hypothetical protein
MYKNNKLSELLLTKTTDAQKIMIAYAIKKGQLSVQEGELYVVGGCQPYRIKEEEFNAFLTGVLEQGNNVGLKGKEIYSVTGACTQDDNNYLHLHIEDEHGNSFLVCTYCGEVCNG